MSTLKVNSVVDAAGTGAPNFDNGLTSTNVSASVALKAPSITDIAGTGSPSFPNGLSSSNIKGRTDGVAVPAGMVGEVIENFGSAFQFISAG